MCVRVYGVVWCKAEKKAQASAFETCDPTRSSTKQPTNKLINQPNFGDDWIGTF
jgi:hypothetical protein